MPSTFTLSIILLVCLSWLALHARSAPVYESSVFSALLLSSICVLAADFSAITIVTVSSFHCYFGEFLG